MITYAVVTLAGQAGVTGFLNGLGSAALFFSPTNVAMDAEANFAIIVC